jgi:hypothetical protein
LKDGVMQPIESVIAALNAAELAQPGPEGVTDEQWDAIKDRLWDKYQTVGYQGERFIYQGDFDTALDVARQKLTRFARPTIEPVPVAERLPGPEDCDEEGRCWWFCPAAILPSGQCAYWCLAPADGSRSWFTHWRPHHALPVPATH